MQSTDAKEALKQLRKDRKGVIEQARRMIKARNGQIAAVKSQLSKEALTVPEIAASIGMATADVMIIIAALRKYGEVLEDVKAGDYFKYRLAADADL